MSDAPGQDTTKGNSEEAVNEPIPCLGGLFSSFKPDPAIRAIYWQETSPLHTARHTTMAS